MTATQTEGERAANALTVPAFRRLWLHNITYFLVANAQRFAFSWVVLDGLGRSEADQGLAVFLLGVPTIVLVLQAGVWADRHDRRHLLISTQLAGAVVLGAVAAALGSGRLTFGWLLVSTILAGTASTIGQPVRSSLVPALVGREQLYSAIAVNAMAMTMSLIFGAVVVKVVGDATGFDGAFWFLAALLLAGATILVGLDVPAHDATASRGSLRSEVRDAMRFVIDHRELRALFGLLLLSSLTVSPAAMVTLQAHVKSELGRSAGAAAIPFTAMGIGIGVTSMFIMRHGSMRAKGAKFQLAMMTGASMTVAMGFTDSFAVTVMLAGVMGLSGGFFINMNQGLIQAHTPAPLMGRVMGLYTLVSQGLFPFGALLLGILAGHIGTGRTLTVVGATAFAVLVISFVTNPRLRAMS